MNVDTLKATLKFSHGCSMLAALAGLKLNGSAWGATDESLCTNLMELNTLSPSTHIPTHK